MVLIPEVRFTIDEVCRKLKARYMAGKKYSIVVVAEGIHHEDVTQSEVPECDRDECGHEKFVGAGNLIGKEIEKLLGIETRVTVLGHVQRGGTPTAFDPYPRHPVWCGSGRELVAGNSGFMVTLQGSRIGTVPLKEVASRIKPVSPALCQLVITQK